MLAQNRMTNSFALDKVTNENVGFKLNEEANSAGFIYCHLGETLNLFGTFFGLPTDVANTTMGQTESGQGQNAEESKKSVEKGFAMLQKLIEEMPDALWLEPIDTPFFGTIPRIRLFSHILFHTSHHAGQISMTLSKGRQF